MKNITLIGFVIAMALSVTACEKSPTTEPQIPEKNISERLSKEVSENMEEVIEKFEEGTISEEKAKNIMIDAVDNSTVMKTELEKQKEEMPKMLIVLKMNRDCIQDADTKADIKACEKKSLKKAQALGITDFYGEVEEDEDFEWNVIEKEQMLADIDGGIIHMEKMLPCLEKANVLSDLMQCVGTME